MTAPPVRTHRRRSAAAAVGRTRPGNPLDRTRVSAVLVGAAFIGVGTLVLAVGTHLRFPRPVALLTAGYSVGQILGPLVVAPLLHHGYHQALILAALVVLAAAAVLRIGFPHHMVVVRHAAPVRQSASADIVPDPGRRGA